MTPFDKASRPITMVDTGVVVFGKGSPGRVNVEPMPVSVPRSGPKMTASQPEKNGLTETSMNCIGPVAPKMLSPEPLAKLISQGAFSAYPLSKPMVGPVTKGPNGVGTVTP